MSELFPRPKEQWALPPRNPNRPLLTLLKNAVIVAVILAVVFFVWSVVIPLFNKAPLSTSEKRIFMGTMVEISAWGTDSKDAVESAFSEMERVSRLLDYHDPKSEVSLINSMAGVASVAVSRSTFDIIAKAVKISKLLGASYAVSAGPLADIWNPNQTNFSPPSKTMVNAARKLVDDPGIELNTDIGSVKLLTRGMELDLGGVAKGYILSVGRNVLVQKGIRSALLSSGTSIVCIGKKPDGGFWKVGIRSPKEEDELIGAVNLMPGQALSTLGDYGRPNEANNQMIDPSTGYPSALCRAVTVITDDAAVSDILSRAVFVMGPAKGLKLLRSRSNTQGLIVDKDGNILKTAGFLLEKEGGENTSQ